MSENHARFVQTLERIRSEADRGAVEASVRHAQAAVRQARDHACGLYASACLEGILMAVGRAQVPSQAGREWSRTRAPSPRRVLHVATQVRGIGGLTRMMCHWMGRDSSREHSLALTGQRRLVPEDLERAVAERGGRVTYIGEIVGGQIRQARVLRALAVGFDCIVLHIDLDDTVAFLALADRRGLPPVLYLDHADHVFWLGVRVSDLVVALRPAGAALAVERRGVEPTRTAILPTPLDPPERTLSRGEAKRRLGLPEDSLVLLSVARAIKFRTIAGERYVDMFLPFLEACPSAFLVIVGPGERPDWQDAIARAGGRIRLHPETPATRLFFEAADIYVDSYPFVSTTSLLEGGSFANPVVTRLVFPDAPTILDNDMPGVERTILKVRDPEELLAVLLRLANDPEDRRRLGRKTREDILGIHAGESWQQALEKLYARASSLTGEPSLLRLADEPEVRPPDLLSASVHGATQDDRPPTPACRRDFPRADRLRGWKDWVTVERFAGSVAALVKGVLPDWLMCAILRRVRL